MAVGPYSLLIDICVTYNHNLNLISFLFKRRQRKRKGERIKITWCVCWLSKEETIILMNFFGLASGLKEHEAPSIVRELFLGRADVALTGIFVRNRVTSSISSTETNI